MIEFERGNVYRIYRYTREMIRDDPEGIYIFGDNLMEKGYGGQAAAARDEPNAWGIPTKITPDMEEEAFFSDIEDFPYVSGVYSQHFAKLCNNLLRGKDIYWPYDGIGTGLSSMQEKCPLIWNLLEMHREHLFSVANQVIISDY